MATSPVGRDALRSRGADPSDDASLRPSGLGRTAVLLLVLAAIGLSLALPVREYSEQRSRIAALSASNAAAAATIAELTAARERWNDPAFIMAQARQRLHLVMPGQTAYIVVEEEPAAATEGGAGTGTWYGTLWSTVTGWLDR